MSTKNFDKKEFRNTLGQFATGVTIITTLNAAKEPIGITVSSFNSLSMEPPMILWSLAKSAYSLPAFQHASHFNVHVLSAEQDQLSNSFARPGTDKFLNINYIKGLEGTPILNKCAALFECRTAHQYDGGDHIIFVGEVLEFNSSKKKPLVFHLGQYTGIDSLI